VLEGAPGAAVPFDGGLDRLRARHVGAHEDVLDRSGDLLVAEPPELELQRRLHAVAEATERFDARSVEAEHLGLARAGEQAVGEEMRFAGGLHGVHARLHRDAVEGFVGERLGEGGLQALPERAVDDDDGAVVLPADEEVLDLRRVERLGDGEEVFDHRLLRREVPVDERVDALALDHVGALEPR
jgi:hypothetical protein